jgi:hypothetical protein
MPPLAYCLRRTEITTRNGRLKSDYYVLKGLSAILISDAWSSYFGLFVLKPLCNPPFHQSSHHILPNIHNHEII